MEIDLLYKEFRSLGKISTDTRKEVKDSIFFALSGENFDGNQYAEQALNKGAAYVVVDKELGIKDKRVIKVSSSLDYLQALARRHRDSFNFPVIGITGTNGKTTTKELIAAVLSTEKRIAFTQGNFNNHIGVPLTLLSITKPVDIAIIEMGANHRGEIYELCKISNPDYGLITNIGHAHLEGFGSFENIVETKIGLYQWIIENSGFVFYNENDTLLSKHVANYTHTISYSPTSLNLISSFPGLKISFAEDSIQTRLIGNYNIPNIAAAIECGLYFGISKESIKNGLEKYTPSNNRSQLFEINDISFVLDSYNANPDSMTLSIDSFNLIESPKDKVLILGDMFELGSYSMDAHRRIILKTEQLQNVTVIFIGKEFHQLRREHDGFFFEELSDFIEKFDMQNLAHKLVLLKGSRGVGLERLLIEFDS